MCFCHFKSCLTGYFYIPVVVNNPAGLWNITEPEDIVRARVSVRLNKPRQSTSSAKQTAHNYLAQPQHHFLQKGSVSVATLLPGDNRICAAEKRKLLKSKMHPAAGNFLAPLTRLFGLVVLPQICLSQLPQR